MRSSHTGHLATGPRAGPPTLWEPGASQEGSAVASTLPADNNPEPALRTVLDRAVTPTRMSHRDPPLTGKLEHEPRFLPLPCHEQHGLSGASEGNVEQPSLLRIRERLQPRHRQRKQRIARDRRRKCTLADVQNNDMVKWLGALDFRDAIDRDCRVFVLWGHRPQQPGGRSSNRRHSGRCRIAPRIQPLGRPKPCGWQLPDVQDATLITVGDKGHPAR